MPIKSVNYSLKYELVASSRALRYVRKAKDNLGGVGTTYVINMWQSRVEIEHYSVAYFDRITAFEAL